MTFSGVLTHRVSRLLAGHLYIVLSKTIVKYYLESVSKLLQEFA